MGNEKSQMNLNPNLFSFFQIEFSLSLNLINKQINAS